MGQQQAVVFEGLHGASGVELNCKVTFNSSDLFISHLNLSKAHGTVHDNFLEVSKSGARTMRDQ